MSYFYKMTASGNDFVVVIDSKGQTKNWSYSRIQAVCNRRFGIGADALLLLDWQREGLVVMKYFNSDGSQASVCGNALLCTARLAALLHYDQLGQVNIVTGGGTFKAAATHDDDLVYLTWPTNVTPRVCTTVEREPGEEEIFFGEVGIPHLCVLVKDIRMVNVQRRGKALRFHPSLGPDGANVNFVEVGSGITPSIRTYERGIEAETHACSTGSLVSAAALVQTRRRNIPLTFRTRSGHFIRIEGRVISEGLAEGKIIGEARLVFTGIGVTQLD